MFKDSSQNVLILDSGLILSRLVNVLELYFCSLAILKISPWTSEDHDDLFSDSDSGIGVRFNCSETLWRYS